MWPCWRSPKYLNQKLVFRSNTQQPRKPPGFWFSVGTSPPCCLPPKSSVLRFKFVSREKVIFTLCCVQDLFKVFIQGSLSMLFLGLSAAAESKVSTVDAAVALWPVLKLDIFVTVCQQGKNKQKPLMLLRFMDYSKEWRPLIQHKYSEYKATGSQYLL